MRGTWVSKGGKNQNLQVIRGIAILLVLVVHVRALLLPGDALYWDKLLTWVHPPVGVDLFFVLSGYLMGRIFLARADAQWPLLETSIFYRRRFSRLIPAAFFWAVVTFVLGLTLAGRAGFLDQRDAFWKFFTSLTFLRNFEQASAPDILGYYWSLSVEAQFYILLPLAWFGLRRWFWPFVIGLLALSVVWRFGGDVAWLFRYDGLLVGLLVWKITSVTDWRRFTAPVLPQRRWMAVAVLWFAAIAMAALPQALPDFSGLAYLALSLIGGYLVLMGLALPDGSLGVTRWDRGAVAWMGEISYSVYLVHIPFFMVANLALSRYRIDPGIAGYLGVILVMLAISYLSYRFIEPLMADSTRKAIQQATQLEGRSSAP